MAKKYSNELLDELDEILDIDKEKTFEKESPVIFDGRQYTIKIPRKIADAANIGRNATFRFSVKTRIEKGKQVSVLEGTLHDSSQK